MCKGFVFIASGPAICVLLASLLSGPREQSWVIGAEPEGSCEERGIPGGVIPCSQLF